jgi:hypothetical protein
MLLAVAARAEVVDVVGDHLVDPDAHPQDHVGEGEDGEEEVREDGDGGEDVLEHGGAFRVGVSL